MDLENVVVAECFAADVAFIGFFSSVRSDVNLLNKYFLFIEIPLKIIECTNILGYTEKCTSKIHKNPFVRKKSCEVGFKKSSENS